MKTALAATLLIASIMLLTHSTTAADQPSLEQQIIAAEREGLDALKRGDVEHFGNLTANEAVFVDPHGPANRG